MTYTDEQILELIRAYTGDSTTRGLGNPSRKGSDGNYYIAHNEYDVLKFMHENVGRNMYITAYGYTQYENPKEDKVNAIIDCIPFDFDSTSIKHAHNDTLKLFNWCTRHNTEPTINFSGKKGYHLYINLKPVQLNYPAAVIRKFVNQISEAAQFTTTMDTSVVGDLNRILRIPGSMHMDTRRYCTPLNPDEFADLSTTEIIEMSKNPTDYIPVKKHASYEIEAYLKELDKQAAIDEHNNMRNTLERVKKSVLSNIWNPDIPKASGHCPAFDRAMQEGARSGANGDNTLAGIIQKLRSLRLPDQEIRARVYEFNKKCNPPFDSFTLDYKIDYHMENEYAPCTFFLKCGDLCRGCTKCR